MKHINKLFTGVLSLSLIMTFAIVPVETHAATIEVSGGATQSVTGPYSASTTAFDVNLATLLSGENVTLNRMMFTMANTCISTTTAGIIKTGSGILSNWHFSGQLAGASAVFRDATTTLTGTIIDSDALVPVATTAAHPTRWPGASFSNGLFLEKSDASTTTVCYL